MRVSYDRSFLKQVQKLPKRHREMLASRMEVLLLNPFDTRLHTKQLSSPLEGVYSFRITRDYRALFRFISEEEIFLLRVKHRKDVYRRKK